MSGTALYSTHTDDDDHELGFDDTAYLTPIPPSRTKLLILISLSSTLLLVFIVVPAAVPDEHTYFSFPKYGLNDLLRTLDPFINFPLIYLIYISARPAPTAAISFLFAISAAIYITGSVSHTTSVMFKHSLEVIQSSLAPNVVPSVTDAYDYMRNIWEHLVGHYLYAAGIFCTSVLTIFVHFHSSYPPLPFFRGWMLLYSGLLSGLLYALVSTQLPYAPLIGTPLFAFISVGLAYPLWKDGELSVHRWATRPIPQLYLISTSLAFILTIIWTAKEGIKGRNLN